MKDVLERVSQSQSQSSMHMWQFKNGWVTQFTNDTIRSLFRQQIIKTTI